MDRLRVVSTHHSWNTQDVKSSKITRDLRDRKPGGTEYQGQRFSECTMSAILNFLLT